MFKLKQSASFRWPVTLELPSDGGVFVKETFDAEFKRLSQSRINELKDEVIQGKSSDEAICREVVVGWSGVTDDGEEVPFSVSALGQLLEINGASGAIVLAFLDSVAGQKRKN